MINKNSITNKSALMVRNKSIGTHKIHHPTKKTIRMIVKRKMKHIMQI